MGLATVCGEIRAHDLLRLSSPTDVPAGAPAWVSESLVRAPWAVVRRAIATGGQVPVGVRGQTRAHRWGTTIAMASAVERLAPEQLVDRVERLAPRTPAAHALLELQARLRTLPVRWGPTGSAGFELATGLATLRPESDIDIVVRAQVPWDLLIRLREALRDLPARVDAQAELDVGAVALEELMSGTDEVLVKTPAGPALMPVAQCVKDR